ncbi:MAG: ribonuclease III [Christensenellaceae bacterium]|jgi:ribonuclease-3
MLKQAQLEDKIGYSFENELLIKTALTHPSRAGEPNYERLEFLGDAVLELAVSDMLYARYTSLNEGQLTQMRAKIVCAKTLAHLARTLDLGAHLSLGNGEERTGGRDKQSILENAMEAVFGAIYVDGGFYAAKTVIAGLLGSMVESLGKGTQKSDYKTQLQEIIQKNAKKEINYLVERQEGPPHDTTFYVRLIIGDDVVCEGIGSSKKEAEQNAAKFALEHIEQYV